MFDLFKSKKQKIKERLDRFEFPTGFFNRLCREQNWNEMTAGIAILEYKKFLYLAKFHDPVTPSKMVDEVWHLHLLYTRNYWDELCGKVLEMKLYHNPALSSDDDGKYKRQYDKTRAEYESNFGIPNPIIWDSPVSCGSLSTTNDQLGGDTFGGGSFGGSGAGSDWSAGSDSSSTGDAGGSSHSCGSSCGGD